MNTWHELKTWPEPFGNLFAGHKTFEIRKEDNRKFSLGDMLVLREWDKHTEVYTGRVLVRRVDYITRGPAWGIPSAPSSWQSPLHNPERKNMKLDRNKNRDKKGKYALLHLRELKSWTVKGQLESDIENAINVLDQAGIIGWGNEAPSEQFFVIKYKDWFAYEALRAYAGAIHKEICHNDKLDEKTRASLKEFAKEMDREAGHALEHGFKIPD